MLSFLLKLLVRGVPALLVLALFVWGFNWLMATRPVVEPEPGQPQIWPVTTVVAAARDAAPSQTVYGTVRAAREADLRFGVAGEVSFVAKEMRDGVRIKKGAELARLDTVRYRLALEEVTTQIKGEMMNIAALERQTELRWRTLERTRKMVARKVASDAALDEAELGLSATANQLDQARARLAQLKVAERSRKQDLADARLTAPFEGVLAGVGVALGQRVSNAAPVARLVDMGSLEVSFVVEAQTYARAAEMIGRPVDLNWRSGQEIIAASNAIITRSEALVDKSEGGGRLYAELAADSPIPPGAFVEVIYVGQIFESVFELPEEALNGTDQVFAVIDGKAAPRQVQLIARRDGRIFVRGEVQEGEQIIATRLPGLGEGTFVQSISNQEPS